VIRRQLVTGVVAFVVLTVLTGVAYPLAVTGVAQVAFPGRADGSLVERDGEVVGSRLIGQAFTGPQYFHPRPSAAGDGYDAMSSSASNLGPTNEDLLSAVRERIAAYRTKNGLATDEKVPVDAVTSSGSGLDPHISRANARLQAPRVARERGIPLEDVLLLVDKHTDGRSLGFLGDPGVNVLELNLALDSERG
jgi:K+-transporting ATPase ATPase C chain